MFRFWLSEVMNQAWPIDLIWETSHPSLSSQHSSKLAKSFTRSNPVAAVFIPILWISTEIISISTAFFGWQNSLTLVRPQHFRWSRQLSSSFSMPFWEVLSSEQYSIFLCIMYTGALAPYSWGAAYVTCPFFGSGMSIIYSPCFSSGICANPQAEASYNATAWGTRLSIGCRSPSGSTSRFGKICWELEPKSRIISGHSGFEDDMIDLILYDISKPSWDCPPVVGENPSPSDLRKGQSLGNTLVFTGWI